MAHLRERPPTVETKPTPADLAAQAGNTYTVPASTRRAVEELVTSLALMANQEAEPDLDLIDSIAKLTGALAQLIDARTASGRFALERMGVSA